MSNTAKFYTAFTAALLIVIALSFYVGYRIGRAPVRVERRSVHARTIAP